MNSIFRIFAVLLFLSLGSRAQAQHISLKQFKVSDSISMLMPTSFIAMTDDEIADAFFSSRKPMACYKDQNSGGILSINESATRWQASDIDMLHLFYRSTLKNTYSDVEFLQDKIEPRDKNRFIVFEFTSAVEELEDAKIPSIGLPSTGGGTIRKYNYMQYTVRAGRVLIFNFSSPLKEKAIWAESMQKMMASVKVK